MTVDRYLRPAYPQASPPEENLWTDILDLLDSAGEGKAYAWSNLAYSLSQNHLLQATRDTTGPFIVADIGSAFTVFPQRLRESHRRYCELHAKEITDVCLQNFPLRQRPTWRKGLLQDIIQTVLYNPPSSLSVIPESQQDERKEVLLQALLDHFDSAVVIYNSIYDRNTLRGKGRFDDFLIEKDIRTFREEVTQVFGSTNTDDVLTYIAQLAADYCLIYARPFSVTSLDKADPEMLRVEAEQSFPLYFTNSEFFARAHQLQNHVQGDIFNLPYQDETISFSTCFECYPLFFRNTSSRAHYAAAEGAARVLRPGGRMLFFPWHVYSPVPGDDERLSEVEQHWTQMGMIVAKRNYKRGQLEKKMSDQECDMIKQSRIFEREADKFTLLVLMKPKQAA